MTGKLQQCHTIAGLRCGEAWPRLSIKTYYLLVFEILYGIVELGPYRVYDLYGPGETYLIQSFYVFCGYSANIHVSIKLSCSDEQQFPIFRKRPHLIIHQHLKMVGTVTHLVHKILYIV